MLGGMTSPPEAGTPHPAQRDSDSAWGAKLALGVVGLIMIAEFVLPGFLAAGLSRSGPYFFSINGDGWDEAYWLSRPPPRLRAELVILAPSDWLMKHSERLRRFYMWQYRRAGGLDIYDVIDKSTL